MLQRSPTHGACGLVVLLLVAAGTAAQKCHGTTPVLCNASQLTSSSLSLNVQQHQWRLFTGLQTFVMTLQGPVVAIAAQGHLLAAVWHAASSSRTDDQCLHYAVFDVSQQQQVRCQLYHKRPCSTACHAPSAMSCFGGLLRLWDLLPGAHLVHNLLDSYVSGSKVS